MIRPARLAALLIALGSLCACSSSHSSSTSATAAFPHVHVSGQPSHAQALAFAHAVNLTAGDVPGFTTSSRRSQRSTPTEQRMERELLGCVGVSGASKSLVEAGSRQFERQSRLSELSVSSEVNIARAGGSPAKGLQAIHSARTRACLTHYFNLLFRGRKTSGSTFGPVMISAGTPPAPGVDGSFGWRMTTKLIGHGVAIPFYVDLLGFVDGQAQVSLLSSGAPLPFPAKAEQELYLLLLHRAVTQRL